MQLRVAAASGGNSNDLTVLIVLIVTLAVVVFLVVAVSVCMCHYRSGQREKLLIVDTDEISQAYGGSSIQAWYPDYKSNNSETGSIGRHWIELDKLTDVVMDAGLKPSSHKTQITRMQERKQYYICCFYWACSHRMQETSKVLHALFHFAWTRPQGLGSEPPLKFPQRFALCSAIYAQKCENWRKALQLLGHHGPFWAKSWMCLTPKHSDKTSCG